MKQRPRPPLWKFWPLAVCAGFVGWELYSVRVEGRPIDWVWMGIVAAIAGFVIIVRGFMRV